MRRARSPWTCSSRPPRWRAFARTRSTRKTPTSPAARSPPRPHRAVVADVDQGGAGGGGGVRGLHRAPGLCEPATKENSCKSQLQAALQWKCCLRSVQDMARRTPYTQVEKKNFERAPHVEGKG